MANATEVERLLVRLVGDSKMYVQTLQEAQKLTQQFTQDASGRFRDMQGKFVAAQTAMRAQAGATLKRLYDLGEGMKTLGGHADTAGKKLRQFGGYLSLRLTTSMTALGAAGAKTFMGYETALTQMIGLVGLSTQEVQKMDQAVRELAPSVGKGPTELADALYFITGSGLQGQLALDALNASAKAAAAGLGETQVVADAVTSAVNAYGADVLSASGATDVLVAAVREGKVEADALAPVLGRLLPTASAMKISFAEVAGVMAVMSRTGLDAAEASTSVGAIMGTLLKPSKEAAETLQTAGLSMSQLRDVIKKPGGLVEVMRILNRTFGEDDEALAKIIPNVRAFRGVMNVLAQDASIVDEIMGGVRNSVGATEAAFQAGANTMERTWGQTLAEIKLALIDLGDILKPVIATLSAYVRDAAKWFRGLSESGKNTVATMLALGAVLGPVITALGLLLGSLGMAVTGMGTMLSSAAVLKAGLMALRLSISALPVALAAAAAAIVYKFHPATARMNAEIERTKQLAGDVGVALDERFSRALERVPLGNLQQDIKGSLAAAKKEVIAFRNEIAYLSNADGRRGVLNALLDSQGIELAKQHLADAESRAAKFASQLEMVNSKLAEMGQVDTHQDILGSIRPAAINEFAKEMESQLRDLEVANAFGSIGMTDEQIQRRQAYFALEAELKANGQAINQVEQDRITLMDRQMSQMEMLIKQRKEAQKEAEKAAEEEKKKIEEAQKSAAQQARQYLEGTLTPIQELRKKLDEVNSLQAQGALAGSEAAKVRAGLVKDFSKSQQIEKVTAGAAVRFGSAESEASRLQRPDKAVEKAVWEQVRLTQVQLRTEQDILTAIKNQSALQTLTIPN